MPLQKNVSALFKPALLALSYLFLSSLPLTAQFEEQIGDMSYETLISKAQTDNADQAVPYIRELIKRLEAEETTGIEQDSLLAQCYVTLCRYHYNRYVKNREEEDSKLTISYGEKLRERFPKDGRGAETLTFESQIYFSKKEWDSLQETLEGGLKGIREGRYASNYRQLWLKDLCLVLAIQEYWEAGEARFRELFNLTLIDDETRTQAAIYLIRSYEVQQKPELVLELIPYLSQADESRYDPGLNLSLFKLGNQFSDDAQYTKGNYLYFLTLTLEDIIEFNQQKLAASKARSKWYIEQNLEIPEEVTYEIEKTSDYIEELKDQNSYTSALKYHRARNLERMKRRYDAFFAYMRLQREHPDDSNAELFHYSAFNQAVDINYIDELIELGESYLARSDFKTYRMPVFVHLISKYFQIDNYAKVQSLGEQFMQEYPEDLSATNVVHFMGYSWTREEKFETLKTKLGDYLEQYPNAPMGQSAHYWIGITQVVEQDFENARGHFKFVIENFESGNFYVDSRFRLGVCEFGLGNYAIAEPMFDAFVAEYPENHLRGEAEVFLGDIAAINAQVPEAMAHYAAVEQYTGKINLIDHAYFEGTRLLEANERFQEVITLLEGYSEKFSEKGSLARAIYKIGETYEKLGEPAKMLASYFDAIKEYGNQASSQGVDQIIMRYVEKYDSYKNQYQATEVFLSQLLDDKEFRLKMIQDRKALYAYRLEHPNLSKDIVDLLLRNETLRYGLGRRELPQTEEEILENAPLRYEDSILPEARAELESKLNRVRGLIAQFPENPPRERFEELYQAAKANNQRTLELRLLMAFDALEMPAPGDTHISVPDLLAASPATLTWIAETRLSVDPELARLAVERVLKEYPFSLAVPDAQLARAEIMLHDGNREAAMKLYRFIIEEYPVWPKAGEVALRIGRLYQEAGDYTNALAQYQYILKVRDWRGVIWAETCFRVGQCFAKQNEILKAHGYYERTYLSYRQFPEWAAKALYEDGKLLEQMNEIQSARSVYNDYLSLPNAEVFTNFDEVKRRYEALKI